MRNIKYIVIHCTATPQNTTIESILSYWKTNLNWKGVGYHYIIAPNGNIVQLENENKTTNGVKGYNKESIHISYIGGVDTNNKAKDNRTEEQKDSMIKIVKELMKKYPSAIVQGHKDFPNVYKACPCFDVKKWILETM